MRSTSEVAARQQRPASGCRFIIGRKRDCGTSGRVSDQSGDILSLCPQVRVEFWGVPTRPRPVNGLVWSPSETAAHILGLRAQFEFVDDGPGIFDVWWGLVTMLSASGKRVHDLRLLALATSRHLDAILTFNLDDFPDTAPVRIVHPAALLS